MKTKPRKQMRILYLLLFAILIMGIGYSAINSITGIISGNANAEVQDGVFIADVKRVDAEGELIDCPEIKYYIGTMMQSSIKLSDTDSNSEITYKVTVHNNSENSYSFLEVLYDETNPDTYDNQDIIFEIEDYRI